MDVREIPVSEVRDHRVGLAPMSVYSAPQRKLMGWATRSTHGRHEGASYRLPYDCQVGSHVRRPLVARVDGVAVAGHLRVKVSPSTKDVFTVRRIGASPCRLRPGCLALGTWIAHALVLGLDGGRGWGGCAAGVLAGGR